MIELLDIKNFQAHKRLTVELDSEATCFVGKSDVGKSAIVRALRWLATNRPSGDDFIRHGAEGTSVQAKVDDNTVGRRKGKGKNVYELEGKEFHAVGSTVPPEISDVLQLTDLHFANQLDAPFWFSLSPGQVSKELNQIVNLDQIDNVLASLAKRIRQSQTEVSLIEDRCQKIDAELKETEWVVEADQVLLRLERKIQAAAEKRIECLVVRDLVDKARTLNETLIAARKANNQGLEAIAKAKEAMEATKQVESLRKLVQDAKRLQTVVADTSWQGRWETVRKAWVAYGAKVTSIDVLKQKLLEWKGAQTQVEYAKKDLQKAEQEFQDETGGVCPICGGELNKE